MPFSLRKSAAQDADFVLALFAREHVKAFTHGPVSADDYLRAIAREGSANFVIERDGEPFGNLVLDTPLGWLAELRVVAMWENGSGGGRFALAQALAIAFDGGAHRFYLEVLAANRRARTLYEAAGLRPEGLFRDGYCVEAGVFADLIPYGILRDEYVQRRLK